PRPRAEQGFLMMMCHIALTTQTTEPRQVSMRSAICVVSLSLMLGLWPGGVAAQSPEGGTRIKDVASLQGISATPVIGYGLVVGLNKTGDKRQTIFSAQTLA